jgi:hypothetical protein
VSGRARRALGAAGLVLALAAGLAGPAHAELGSPDASWRDAMLEVRMAARDTTAHAVEPGRLTALGAALVKVARFDDAEPVLRRALALNPGDREALAALGRVALCRDHTAEAESLLTAAGDADGAPADLYRARLRRHEWAAAAAMCEDLGEGGRRELLERLAATPAPPPSGAERASLPFVRSWPSPLVRVQLGRELVTMALDPGANELLIDASAAARIGLAIVPGERTVGWSGARVAARNAIVPKLVLGGIVLEQVPAAVTRLHAWSLQGNPGASDVAGVIGLPVLERLGVTIDFKLNRLELRRPGVEYDAPGARVPFERWGENDLMVRGSLGTGRRMALWFGTSLPGAGVGAPQETFDEIGVRPGRVANLVKGASLFGRPAASVGVPGVAIGPIAIERAAGLSGAMDAADLWRWGPRRDAVLGPTLFEGRRVTIDWARHELVFEEAK